MTDNNQIEKNITIVRGFERKANKLTLGPAGAFIKALWNAYKESDKVRLEYRWNRCRHFDAIHSAYRLACGRTADSCVTLDEFFNPRLSAALNALFGKEETVRLREECALVMEFPYSHTVYRPSYRSHKAGDYVDVFFMTMVNSIDFSCYGMGVAEALSTRDALLSGLDNRAALALRQGDEEVFALIEEAVLGDNSKVQMSNLIISAVVKSGEPRVLEQLGKLLLAAKGQEGLRQAILETCDSGTLSSHMYFIRLILENGLCRFSSVVRAFDTWTGLGYGDQKQKVVEKCMDLAQKCLSDEQAAEDGMDSSDTTWIYLALWSLACRDVYSADSAALHMMDSDEKYKRLVAWYFVTNTNNMRYRHELAARRLDVRDPEELAWVCSNLYQNNQFMWGAYGWDERKEKDSRDKSYSDEVYPAGKKAREDLFGKVFEVAEFIGKKNTAFPGSVFPWNTVTLNADGPCGCMLGLAGYDRSPVLIGRLAPVASQIDSNKRLCYYSMLLDAEIPEQRAVLLSGLSDRSQAVRERVVLRLGYYKLDKEDVARLTDTLTTQSADLRKGIITLFGKQREALIRPSIEALLGSKNKNQLKAGLELLDIFAQKNPDLRVEYEARVSALSEDKGLSQDISIILDKVVPGDKGEDEYSAENGFGLFDRGADVFDHNKWAEKRPQIRTASDTELKALIIPDEKAACALYSRILSVFEENKDYEYETENWQGTKEKALLHDDKYRLRLLAGHTSVRNGQGKPITDFPLADLWQTAAGEFMENKWMLVALMSIWDNGPGFRKVYTTGFRSLFSGYPVDSKNSPLTIGLSKYIETKDVHLYKLNQVINALINTGEDDLFDYAFSAYVNLVRKIPDGKMGEACEKEKEKDNSYSWHSGDRDAGILASNYLGYWRNLAYRNIVTDEQFADYFGEMWYETLAAGGDQVYGLGIGDIFRAHGLGLIPDEAVHYCLTSTSNASGFMRFMSGTGIEAREVLAKYPAAGEMMDKVMDRIVTIEENRGELVTPVTMVASQIGRFGGGVRHFVKLIAALGDAGFNRGFIYHWSNKGDITKKESLSQLLKRCQPTADDGPEALGGALKQAKITEKRAIQAALYAPQWAGLVEEAMGIAGLKCGVWFFHAHINEYFTAEKETEAAIFSAITPQQFNDGAFDKAWFFEAYSALGDKRFSELYKNAKYITSSNVAHRRSQLYADAVLGRLGKEQTKGEIIEKRNQEKLRAFALIPLDRKNKRDALERYEFIQGFRKESRQFGSQRQASEGKACQIALDNLAITTGYDDAERMTWALEGEKIEQMRPLMEAHKIGDTEVRLGIDEDGTPELIICKNGKTLKSLPKALVKDPYVADLKDAVKQLRDQKSRARYSFEAAMISRAEFSASEITGLLNHLVLRGMVGSLVFLADGGLGFPVLEGGKLCMVDAAGEVRKAAESEKFIIAHPCDFIANKQWSEFQQNLYRNKTVQPFKQVFREYYPMTEDEKEAVNVSRRYDGNQVQPKKTVALLKTRGWTVDYEEGLQRVWHKENLIVRMYAMADWFSPAEIEAPTLETVRFFRRDKYELVPFADVPPVIFSETMRDIDLVVSVAHVGGVDPEASHSTVEMRIAIARELLSMLSVDNVEFLTAHAKIAGSLGEYSVHMGSGVIHKPGTGMIAVLPVHSQARGRIFLPFADDDPKTAEVMSKILLLADDKSIKDPSILSQIKG
ncbi:MAG: DUF4132 domain-containing protein [Clostridiales bacterium]|nr:DUF4132 domain-containing protein [Clostridiales bacterium]